MNNNKKHKTVLFESAEELYHDAPCGYVSFSNDGIVYNINQTLIEWLGYEREEILGKKKIFDFFKMGGRLYFETHFFPLIRMQGFANEINFEIQKKD
ncbi:PAS domain-containing protein [Christiangramia echinicola]|uniref:PAS domain-containing protein n=1 Tax=Christiangramia echinicola TaxID=279359 RepID=UPI0004225C98|nr:PAS domain-containing protein [Christiangramia echinicola]